VGAQVDSVLRHGFARRLEVWICLLLGAVSAWLMAAYAFVTSDWRSPLLSLVVMYAFGAYEARGWRRLQLFLALAVAVGGIIGWWLTNSRPFVMNSIRHSIQSVLDIRDDPGFEPMQNSLFGALLCATFTVFLTTTQRDRRDGPGK
jgi:hypothetical protein